MAGMLQILTYMFAFYLLLKGVEILQIALASSREDRSPMVGLATLTIAACAIAAYAFTHMQDNQAQSLQGIASGSLSESSYSPKALFGSSESDDAIAAANAAVEAARLAQEAADAAALPGDSARADEAMRAADEAQAAADAAAQ